MCDIGMFYKADVPMVTTKSIVDIINRMGDKNFITGEYVYKHFLRGEMVPNVDVITGNYCYLVTQILKAEQTAYQPYFQRRGESFHTVEFKDSNMAVGVEDYSELIKDVRLNGLNPTNSLVLTKDGVRHIMEVPELAINLENRLDNPREERTWMMENMKAGRYCKWKGMRDRDTEYFKNWMVIDFQECEMHGIYDRH